MFDHVTIRVSDRARSERFYATVLAAIGVEQTHGGDVFAEWNDFSLAQADRSRPVTTRLHIGFAAPSRDLVDVFWRAGLDAGFHDNGSPGERPEYREDYYGAFLLDPDGNSAEAMHHASIRPGGVDHLWIRVADLQASTRCYETVGSSAGFRRGGSGTQPDRTLFSAEHGSFSVVADGPATQNVHVAFGAADDATVDRFHAEATGAGFRDNGPPGERPQYHSGYYAAFVLDPDGNNVEVVNHNR